MDTSVVLCKCATLLYRESQLENVVENSSDLVRTVLEKVLVSEADVGILTRRSATSSLKEMVAEMSRNPPNHQYELTEFLQQVRIVTAGDENLYNAIAQGIENELQGPILKRTITNLKKTLTDFYREQKAGDLLRKASRDFNFNRNSIQDKTAYLNNLINELTAIAAKTSAKDPALIRSMDFADEESMREVFEEVHSSASEGLAFRTGWMELDMALQGGPRPGDCLVTAALQHNYKTGSSLSLFSHFVLFNKPRCKDPNKKPLAFRITAEDPLRNNAQFLYQLLMYEETGEKVEVKNVPIDEMIAYVKKRLSCNGYHVKMDEINPTTTTYQSIINRMLELESMGYVIEIFSIDYLSKISTAGCNQGALGDDMLDLLQRMKAYCASNGILFHTPHQLDTKAKQLLQVVPPDQFLNHIKGGGFFEKTKALDRIYDIGLLMHKIETPEMDYLHMVVDKHRLPTVVESSLKSFYLAFPKNGMPIPSNYNKEGYKILRKIPKHSLGSSKDDGLFD